MDELQGYRGLSREILERFNVRVGDLVELVTDNQVIKGTIVPRYQYDDEYHVVLKLKSGYNIGIRASRIIEIKLIEHGKEPSFKVPEAPHASESLPRVAIISTGGTIASRVDYRTGAVHPAISANELYALVPELSTIARIEPEILASIYSENMETKHWSALATRVEQAVNDGVSGVVITHGTDTMGYTAAALSFALKDVTVPVILVGAQRSSDRPSSDATLNLIAAVDIAANSNIAGVFVAMHSDKSDESVSLHLGTRVRKNHTSSRDAFSSIGIQPVITWRNRKINENFELRKRSKGKFKCVPGFNDSSCLLKFYPCMQEEIVRGVLSSGVRAVIIEGSGLGHINSKNIKHFARYVEQGNAAFMTSQCIWGRVNMNVYDTGRDLLSAGVVPLDDMIPETALVKSMWALANTSTREELVSLMKQNIAGEYLERTTS